MAETAPLPPQLLEPGDADRFGLALFFALALHALLILGITFDLVPLKKSEPRPLSLEVTLVHSRSEKPPEEADYLAQANQQGGGNVRENVRPSSPFPNPRPANERGDARTTQAAGAPPPRPEQQDLLTAERSRSRISMRTEPDSEPVPELPPADQLLAQSREIARLSAEIRQRQEAYAKQPRKEIISSNTKEYIYAAYEDAWRLKVERIGNLNYPEEAKRGRITGDLVLAVSIRTDGSLQGVEVTRSSGHQVLDDAAVRIVRMAAPFAPFTDAMRERIDILEIVRVWQFDSGNQLSTAGR